jgi:uncharacterized protein (DUF433 family)
MAILLGHYIESATDIRGGKPRIAGTRMTVADLVVMHVCLGQPLPEIAEQSDLSLASVYAAMAYYYDHREEIDHSLEQDTAMALAFEQGHTSALKQKLNTLQ